MKEYILRDYQVEASDKAIACLENKKNGILVLPTGSGKSLIVADIATKLPGKTLVFQPSKEILEQNKSKVHAFGYHDIGVYSASAGRKDIGIITFATIGSVINKAELFCMFERIIIDECHRVNPKGGMYANFIEELKIPCIGLTATPYRLKSYRDMKTGIPTSESRILTRTRPRMFSTILHITQVKDLFSAGHLCPLTYEIDDKYDSRAIQTNSTGQDFDDKALRKYNKEQQIVKKVIKTLHTAPEKHCLAFTKFTAESKQVVEGLTELGVSCATVSAQTKPKDRVEILRAFTSGEIKCVVNVGVLTTGFDFPELNCIILGRPTKSVALYYQMTGRGIRPAPGKETCRLVDLCGNVKQFGHIETFELFDQTDNELWRLKSDKGYLTGVDVTSGYDLERRYDYKDDVTGVFSMPFGKHKGLPLSEIPTGYLEWGARELSKKPLVKLFKTEILRRETRKGSL